MGGFRNLRSSWVLHSSALKYATQASFKNHFWRKKDVFWYIEYGFVTPKRICHEKSIFGPASILSYSSFKYYFNFKIFKESYLKGNSASCSIIHIWNLCIGESLSVALRVESKQQKKKKWSMHEHEDIIVSEIKWVHASPTSAAVASKTRQCCK